MNCKYNSWKRLWAKKSDRNGLYWLPLIQHLEDTRQICGLLWEHWLSEGIKEFVVNSIENGTDEKAKNLVMFLGAIHDIGKATPSFQAKEGFGNSADLDIRLKENLEKDGFKGISTFNLSNYNKTPHSLAGQSLLELHGVNICISSIVGSHHGKPSDSHIKDNIISYKANYFQTEDKNNQVYKLWEQEQTKILKWALEKCNFFEVSKLPMIKQPCQIILSGLLIMADWIASNETYFPLINIDENYLFNESRIQEGFKKWYGGMYLWDIEVSNVIEMYQRRFNIKEPREVQSKMFDLIEDIDNPGIVILEAPMGIGKTEAALIAVEQLANKTGRSGMYFGLPTQATSDGIFPRIKRWLKESTINPQSIRLVHGKASLNKEFTDLPRSTNIYGDEEEPTVLVNEWFTGRKVAMLDSFTVGTVDQFLLIALKQKHLALRHLGFSKKVVVIDEVHAYDAYMSVYLMEALKWMGSYGVPIVILSATLPIEKRNQLIENYMRGCGYKPNKLPKPEKYENNKSYPLITYNDGVKICQFSDFDICPGEKVTLKKLSNLEVNEICELVKVLISDGGVLGIVVNTVKKAQDIAMRCIDVFGEENVDLLHSSFISTDRIKKEENLLKLIGKGANRPYQRIIIGTQVIEQSLDIDFDVMISDLAPMDLLIQRIGRLHRHDAYRPETHIEPVLYVLGANDIELDPGSVSVYGGYILYRTKYLLPESINLPNDISELVQDVYSKEKMSINLENDKIYNKYKEENEQLLKNKEIRAKTFRLSDPIISKLAKKSSMIGWLSNINIAAQESDEKAFAQVRDSDDSIEVIAIRESEGKLTLFNDSTKTIDLSIPGESKEVAKQTLKIPSILCKTYNIDKTIKELEEFNKKHLINWQKDPWLKGELGIIFNENNQFFLNGYILTYDKKYGLMYEKESEDG